MTFTPAITERVIHKEYNMLVELEYHEIVDGTNYWVINECLFTDPEKILNQTYHNRDTKPMVDPLHWHLYTHKKITLSEKQMILLENMIDSMATPLVYLPKRDYNICQFLNTIYHNGEYVETMKPFLNDFREIYLTYGRL